MDLGGLKLKAHFISRGAIAAAVVLLFSSVASAIGAEAPYYVPGSSGYDISFPQCSSRLPKDGNFGIIGVTNGLPWSQNPCLATQVTWAESLPSPMAFYVNTANPGPQSPYWNLAGPKPCNGTFTLECAYNYGWNAADQAFATVANARSVTIAASRYWWVDVETVNSWNGSNQANAETIKGYVDYLKSRNVAGIGVYSTASQWTSITGGLQLPDVATWIAGARTENSARNICNSTSFNGGQVILAQYSSKGFSADLVCGGTKPGR